MAATVMTLDDDGVPVSDYGTMRGVYVGPQRSIVAVAEKGLDYWSRSNKSVPAPILSYSWEPGRDLRTVDGLDSPVSDADGFLNCSEWLMDNAHLGDGYVVWKYAYAAFYGTKAGWRCAHAQGQAIRLLIRAYETTQEARFADMASMAVRGFGVAVKDNGIAETFKDGSAWYHKFADEDAQKPYVLNGMLFGLLGLLDAVNHMHDDAAEEYLAAGWKAVDQRISDYDQDGWSAYNIDGRPTSMHYHEIHCRQLDRLLQYRSMPSVEAVLAKWSSEDVSTATGGRYERSARP